MGALLSTNTGLDAPLAGKMYYLSFQCVFPRGQNSSPPSHQLNPENINTKLNDRLPKGSDSVLRKC